MRDFGASRQGAPARPFAARDAARRTRVFAEPNFERGKRK
jgi:hypothetical protein